MACLEKNRFLFPKGGIFYGDSQHLDQTLYAQARSPLQKRML